MHWVFLSGGSWWPTRKVFVAVGIATVGQHSVSESFGRSFRFYPLFLLACNFFACLIQIGICLLLRWPLTTFQSEFYKLYGVQVSTLLLKALRTNAVLPAILMNLIFPVSTTVSSLHRPTMTFNNLWLTALSTFRWTLWSITLSRVGDGNGCMQFLLGKNVAIPVQIYLLCFCQLIRGCDMPTIVVWDILFSIVMLSHGISKQVLVHFLFLLSSFFKVGSRFMVNHKSLIKLAYSFSSEIDSTNF